MKATPLRCGTEAIIVHTTEPGVRYTIPRAALREVLARLLKQDHGRNAAGVALGPHDEGKKIGRTPEGVRFCDGKLQR